MRRLSHASLRPGLLRTWRLRPGPQSQAPVPVYAVFFSDAKIIHVEFNRTMQPNAALDGFNWRIRSGIDIYAGDSAEVVWPTGPPEFNDPDYPDRTVVVTLGEIPIGSGAGDQVCWYDPPPFDTASEFAVLAEAFTGLAYTEI